MRVLAYNVRSLRDDGAALARVIRAAEPDVACIQEAPRRLRWRSKCAALARESGLLYVTGGRSAGDCLLLAKLGTDPADARSVLLSKTAKLHQRGVALARFHGVTIASVHLGLDAAERRRHAEEALALLGDGPVVLAGDVNEEPGAPAWQAIADRVRDTGGAAGPTFPARDPRRRIDGVFATAGIEVVSYGVPDVPEVARASDHLPVLAVLRVPG